MVHTDHITDAADCGVTTAVNVVVAVEFTFTIEWPKVPSKEGLLLSGGDNDSPSIKTVSPTGLRELLATSAQEELVGIGSAVTFTELAKSRTKELFRDLLGVLVGVVLLELTLPSLRLKDLGLDSSSLLVVS